MPKVSIILGSDSDWPIIEPGYLVLKEFGIGVDVLVASAHRTPRVVEEFAVSAREKGAEVLIAVAGAAAHLPGVVAAWTTLPVIGVPVAGHALAGMDALFSILQMPSGVPVGTMAIDGGKNAALYAISILALKYEDLARRLLDFREAQARMVARKNEVLQAELAAGDKTEAQKEKELQIER
ncbi:MAG: 5-(carboxyamino)imidazole ribonucleotide mutase [Synergistaceae bacterium]|jgi:5-(carboxyamino)imidazole ribonucleotide mutase|nr:5-(carboxyamino)imidazole ribonucleotide mutase [Synergistaceae bacterium]